jgi:hypothetical protein
LGESSWTTEETSNSWEPLPSTSVPESTETLRFV